MRHVHVNQHQHREDLSESAYLFFVFQVPNLAIALACYRIDFRASGPKIQILGRRKRTPPCSSAELFFAEKNGVHSGKISVVDMVFPVFIGFLYPPPAWKVFL